MIARRLRLGTLLKQKSIFLFGPRSTGKSTLVRQTLQKAFVVDLLHTRTFLRLSEDPSLLEALYPDGTFNSRQPVVIDEVQKLPILLDEVHRLIELRQVRFLLTGSSARKLRRGQANLLAGRAWNAELFPLTMDEIPKFSLDRYLRYGGLPQVWSSASPAEELDAYVHTYLKEEIQAEGLVRKLPAFLRFLRVAALSSGQLVNFQAVASDAGVPVNTVRDHFSILTDTLVGFFVEPWRESKKRKAIATAKFYLFDSGVFHTLIGTTVLDQNSNLYGQSFEQIVAMELRAYLSYERKRLPLHFWRSESGFEVDFLIGDRIAIEVKATRKVTERDKRGLRALQEENACGGYYLVSLDELETTRDAITCLPLRRFVKKLWSGELL